MDDFNFLCENSIFGKNTKVIVHGFVKKVGFSDRNWNHVRMCVLKLLFHFVLFSLYIQCNYGFVHFIIMLFHSGGCG